MHTAPAVKSIAPLKRTQPPEVRKAQLLAAARKLLAEKGYSQMRVSEVVELAGVSQGSFYLHFASKEDIVVELARCMIGDAMVALSKVELPQDDMETALANVVGAYYRVCFQYRDVLDNTDNGAVSGLDHEKWNEVYKPLNEFSLQFMRDWQKRGEIRADVDANIVSWLFIDTVNGALTRLFGRSGNRVSKDYEAQIVAWLLSALKNLQPARKQKA